MPDTAAIWRKRVAGWRASGQAAEEYSAGRGFAASTLRWWASKLKRDASARPVVRVAQLVRSGTGTGRGGSIVIEVLEARMRITVEPGADRETLAIVLGLVRGRSG